jgi:hypothetical protein
MNTKLLYITFLGIFLAPTLQAKRCTESDIRNALNSKNRFDFNAENCTDEIIYIRKGIELKGGKTIDGQNRMRLSWKGTGEKCDEIPRGPEFATFYTTGNNNVIKNLTILLSPEGIHLSRGRNNLVDNVRFERICEDAITNGNKKSTSATDSIIRNSTFLNAPDKAIQCNGGSMTVQNSVFRNVPRAIGACTYKADPGNHVAKECPQVCHIKAYDNKVYGCRGYGMRGAGYLQGKKQGTLTAVGNYFENCGTPLMSSQYGYIYAEDNTTKGSCSQFANTEQNGSGDICSNNISSCKKEYSGNIKKRCLAQNPAPPSTPSNPTPAPSQPNTAVYKGEGTGGSQITNISSAEREKLACSRAKDRALVNARAQCSGQVTKQSTDNCSKRCTHSGKSVTCNSTATIECSRN